MKNIKNFTKKNKVKIIIGAILLFILIKILFSFLVKKPITNNAQILSPEVINISVQKTGTLETMCSVIAASDAAIIPEAGGKVISPFVKDGDSVKKGQKLFSIENIQQRVSVQNAQVAVKSAELALSELLKNNDTGSNSSILSQTTSQQESFVANARNAYLNNDLRAYPEEYDENSNAPIISGNYTCDKEGTYILSVYASAAESGASLRISGLESGQTTTVTTDYPVALGSCGLEIVFPKEFKKTIVWNVAVPNIRSGSYYAVKKSYESALSGKDIVINKTQASPEQIARERARVSQARLQLQSAYETLEKTTVKAAVSGTVSGFDVDAGDFVTAFSEMGRIKSIGDLELVAYVNADEKNYIKLNTGARVDEMSTTVSEISTTIDSKTKKIKIVLNAPEKNKLTEGTQMSCQIERSVDEISPSVSEKDAIVIPLSALSIIGQKSYVFKVIDNIAVKQEVETGSLLGRDLVVYGLDSAIIIADARGIREGQILTISNE